MASLSQVLVVSSNSEDYAILARALVQCGLAPTRVSTVSDALAEMTGKSFDMVFCESRLRDGSFRDIMRIARSGESGVPVVVWSGFYDHELYIEAMCLGAFDYVALHCRDNDMAWIINNAANRGLVAPSARAASAE